MRLAAWRIREGLKQSELAVQLGCDQGFVSRIERSVDAMIPRSHDFLRAVYILTKGEVTPNDFYGVEEWEAAQIRAEGDAALATLSQAA